MSTPPVCAHRCEHVQAGALREARTTGLTVEAVRINAGLTRDYVPLAMTAHVCIGCTAVHTSPLAAAECCDTPRGHL